MPTLGWFQCFSGIAGDMALGALIDAGASADAITAAARRLDLPEAWELTTTRVLRNGLSGLRAEVRIDEAAAPHRKASEILERIGAAGLDDRVTARSLRTFELLAEVEGALHGADPADVTFHEVGATDSIVDIVGVCVALEELGIDTVCASPVAQGHGTIKAAHGVLPNPPPAVVGLLTRARIPTISVDVPKELTTPTGAALLAALGEGFGPMPDMTPTSSGFGAGGRDLPGRPNLTQVIVGEVVDAPLGSVDTLVKLEATVDDATGETLGHAVAELLGAGALDVWVAAVTMKKGRPGHVVTALVRPGDAPMLRHRLAVETGSLGVRASNVERWAAARTTDTVEVDGQMIRMKVTSIRAKPEHDDVVLAAASLGLPLREVSARADAAWRARSSPQ